MNNIHPFGTIRPQEFPPVPPCKTGYRWIDGGEVKLIPTKNWESDYDCDANTKKLDYTNYSKVESNLKTTGFDHNFEPGHAVPIPDTDKFSGKSSRTRHAIFDAHNVPQYPVRLMEPIEGYDERISAFSVAMGADLGHKPARELSMEQIAQGLWNQKENRIPWYHGQPVNLEGDTVYGDDEFDYAYDIEFGINQQYENAIPRGKIKAMVERGFSTAVKINDKELSVIKRELKDHPLTNGSDGYKVSILIMDDAGSNAPAKLWALWNNSKIKRRQILVTKDAETAEAVLRLRETWRKTLLDYADMPTSFALTNEENITKSVKAKVQKERIKKLFANFELYGYNHLEGESKEELVKIDMFTTYYAI